MENSTPRCDCLQDKTADFPAGRFAHAAHIDERVVQLDHHVQQLIELRSTLLHRSNQLRSPFYAIPSEIISHIFRDVVQTVSDSSDWEEARYHADPRQALVLSSVSRCFRQVALGTPELWTRLDFEFSSIEQAITKFLPLFQHCVSHISRPYFDISLRFGNFRKSWHQDVSLITQLLCSSDTAHKVKHLTFHNPPRTMLSASLLAFSSLDTLVLTSWCTVDLNLEALPLSQVSLHIPSLESIALPPSVLVLHLNAIARRLMNPILRQCPNLVKCSIGDEASFIFVHDDVVGLSLSLDYLKQLTCSTGKGLDPIKSIRRPSLERLQLNGSVGSPRAIVSLCQRVSATLISLDFRDFAFWNDNNMRKLCRLHFPHLEGLRFCLSKSSLIIEVIEALLFQAKSEKKTPEVKYMPNLGHLALLCDRSTLHDPTNRFPTPRPAQAAEIRRIVTFPSSC